MEDMKCLKFARFKISPHFNIKLPILMSKYLGYWPPFNRYRKIYRIFTLFSFCCTLGVLMLTEFANILVVWGNTDKMAAGSFVFMTNVIHFLKIQNLCRKQNQIQALLKFVEEGKFMKKRKNYEYLIFHFTWIGIFHHTVTLTFGILSISGWGIVFLVRYMNGDGSKSWPIDSWYPFDTSTSPISEIIYIHQVIAFYICAIHNLSLDTMAVGFMSVVCCQLEILKQNIRNIKTKVEGRLVDKNEKMKSLMMSKENDEYLYKQLMDCVDHHITIIRFTKDVESIFSFVVFLQFLNSCIVICTTAFQFSRKLEYFLVTSSTYFLYLLCMVYELFVYCWYGNEILLQIVNILRHQKQIQALLDLVKSETFNRHNVELKHHLTRYTWQGIYHYIAYQSFGLIAVLCWGFTPIADFIAGYKRRLPIDAWYPYNVTKTPAFEITCAHQSVAIIMCCFHDVATDTLVTGLITIACCQLELLKYKIMTIKNDVNDKLLIDCQRLRILKVQKSNDRGYEELRKCIEHNNVIVNFTKEIQEIFGITILVQFLINCIIICLTAFHITQMKVYIPADLIGMISYTCCMIYQIFIYCWHGNELYLQSESVVLAAYSGNWWKYSERYKRAIRLIMLGASRPLTFTAGCLMTLSLHTFVGILRASYSFFTVLQSTTNKNK